MKAQRPLRASLRHSVQSDSEATVHQPTARQGFRLCGTVPDPPGRNLDWAACRSGDALMCGGKAQVRALRIPRV